MDGGSELGCWTVVLRASILEMSHFPVLPFDLLHIEKNKQASDFRAGLQSSFT